MKPIFNNLSEMPIHSPFVFFHKKPYDHFDVIVKVNANEIIEKNLEIKEGDDITYVFTIDSSKTPEYEGYEIIYIDKIELPTKIKPDAKVIVQVKINNEGFGPEAGGSAVVRYGDIP